jgi:protein-S-isoprenylcysteine O-methyltransferase Ste14
MTMPNGTKKNIPILIAAIAGAIATLILRRMPPVVRAIRPIMDIPHAMLLAVAILCIFSIYWSAAAKDSKPAASSESTASRQLHLFLVNGGVLLLFLSIPGLTRRFLPAGPIFPALGIAIELAGFALAVWARRALGSNWSGEVRIATGHQLVRTGPYKHIRHPIYTAILGMYFGIMLASGELHAVIAFVVITLAYLRKIRMEETVLAAAFGEEFASWRRDSWALAPPLY